MSEKKMTRVEALNIAIDLINLEVEKEIDDEYEEACAILNKMVEQMSKPRKKAEGPSKARRDNERLAHEVAEAIAAKGERVTSKWVTEHVRGILTPQKATAVAKVGIELGILTREKEGKSIFYDVA